MLTEWTLDEVEDYSGTVPALVDLLEYALVMNYVSTFELNTWRLTQASCIANGAIVILITGGSILWIHFGNALRFKAGQALLFIFDATTWMAAFEDSLTAFRNQFLAGLRLADFAKGWSMLLIRNLQIFEAESALHILQLIACFAEMVWLRATLSAKVLFAFIATDSVLSHVLRRLLADLLSFLVFEF